MAFDYNSRTKWEKERIDQWNRDHQHQIDTISGQTCPGKKELLDEVCNFSSYPHCGFPAIRKWVRENIKKEAGSQSLKEILYERCADMVELLVPAQYREDFDYMLEQFVDFQYTRSLFRPTVRTADPAAHVLDAFGLMQGYKVLGIYGVTPLEYLTEKALADSHKGSLQGSAKDAETVADADGSAEVKSGINDEFLDFKHNDNYARDLHMVQFDDILAARIDRGDAAVIEAVQEALLSENNTVIVTVPLIRAVVKSRDQGLHEILARFLVAARLQEGVRQAVCENADCGRAEAFLTILKAIEDNGMLRFSAVKRAIATWTGICNPESMDRISEKLLSGIGGAVRDRHKAIAMTRTDDSVQIVTGLWALGFYEARDAVDRMLEIVESGSRNQRLTISYYNRYMQFSEYSEQAAQKILETYPEDPEMAAAFMPTYLDAVDRTVRNCIRNAKKQPVYAVSEDDLTYLPLRVENYFDSREQALRHYEILKNLAAGMKKRKIEYIPLVFPWYGAVLDKSDLTKRIALIAYALQDQALIDEVCVRLTDIMDSYYNTRFNYLRILLHAPRTKIQREALIGYAADKESFTRMAACQILKKLQSAEDPDLRITDDEYRQLEMHLRLKNEETRRYVIELLEGREEAKKDESIRRLLGGVQGQTDAAASTGGGRKKKPLSAADRKKKPLSAADREQMRLAGLDMLKRRCEKSEEEAKKGAALLREILPDDTGLSDREKVLYGEIAASGGAGSILNTEGYGLYDPQAEYEPVLPEEKVSLQAYFSLSTEQLDGYFDRIRKFIEDHGRLEYTSANGDRQLLENGLYMINYEYSGSIETRYPFPELWVEVYNTIIREPRVFFNLYFAIRNGFDETDVKDVETYRKAEKTIFGEAWSGYHYGDPKYTGSRGGHSTYQTILDIISSQQHLVLPPEIARAAVMQAVNLPEEVRWMEKAPSKYQTYYTQQRPALCFLRTDKFRSMLSRACHYENDREFTEVFPLLFEVDRVYQFDAHEPKNYTNSSRNILSIYSYVKACQLGLITEDYLYKAAFEMIGLKFAVGQLGELFRPSLMISTLRNVQEYMPVDLEKRTIDKECRFYRLCAEVYSRLTDLILDVELKRGDTPTVFSEAVSRISMIEGIPRLMEILCALGKEPLDRNTYYSFSSGTSKKECLSHLLKVCYPIEESGQKKGISGSAASGAAAASADGRDGSAPERETAEDLKRAVKQNRISTDRLVEVAMYAPQWLDLVEEALGIEGLKSGCYYFMAHMNERFDDRKKVVIARYTPLLPEELNNGCFDTNWFFEVYEKLGEKNFAKLYKAAKYIADGSKHTRARKYADAASGKVDRDELEKAIADKRNKDLLMSYGLIPVKDRQDALHRYGFLQKFLKESRQFGAQRRQSEAQCVRYALKNMATTAGYVDELRLTLAMETELVTTNQQYFDGMQIGGYQVRILVDRDGKAELRLSKEEGGRVLKSVPAAIKKEEGFLAVKEFAAKLKDQYARCAAMFERAMEEEEVYSFGELLDLCRNPVTAGILERLVFIREGAAQKEGGNCLTGTMEELKKAHPPLSREEGLLVAHPVTLCKLGKLTGYQRVFFEKQKQEGTKQPFKQVFREFYPKLEEEKDAVDSRLFAGYQIQPKKTLAVLRGRRWVADYDEGLQKTFFRQGIAATIYALADWFSPADTESPTLEYVSFYDRKTYKQKKLSQVPDVLYSEVMRDVDLAVSTAHVGGVDPETSHSTIEMRRVIFAFNMELFGLTNVTFEGTHAFIKGTLNNYNIQLGSGVIHKESGGMVNILPVHSQQRGKIFLPFIDEDPKTAEILSKILLLAEDHKIKDPYILQQIR